MNEGNPRRPRRERTSATQTSPQAPKESAWKVAGRILPVSRYLAEDFSILLRGRRFVINARDGSLKLLH